MTIRQLVMLVVIAAGCDRPTAQAPDNLNVRVASQPAAGDTSAAANRITVSGTNGTIVIADVGLIVSKLELEGSDGACDRSDGEDGESDDGCEGFGFRPRFVRLPLSSGGVTVATDSVPPGTYRKITLKVDDVEDDDHGEGADDHGEHNGADFSAALAAARAAFPDWPMNASLVVTGRFTKAGTADTASFKAYFGARLKVKMDLDPALVVNASGASRTVTIDIQPSQWFKSGDRVIDLTEFDFAKTKRVFELDLRNGFRARVDH